MRSLSSFLAFVTLLTSIQVVALISSVDRADMATATGLTYLFRYVGQVVGVASSASLLQSVLTFQLHKRITGHGSAKVRSSPSCRFLLRWLTSLLQIIDQIRHVATSIPSLPPAIQQSARDSYNVALRSVFALNLIIAVACWVSIWPLKEYPLPGSFAEEDEQRRQRSGAATPIGEGAEEGGQA